MSFQNSLQKGKKGEQIVVDYLNENGIFSWFGDGRKYDIYFKLGRKHYTAEIKYDIYSKKSGNIAVEIFNTKTNRESGILSTTSDIFCFVLPCKSIYFSTVPALKQFMAEVKYDRMIESGGDNNATLLLYKKEIILPNFVRIDELAGEKLKQELKRMLSE